MIVNNIQFTVSLKYLNMNEKNLRRKIEDYLQEFKMSYVASPSIPAEFGRISPIMFGQTSGGHSHIQISEQAIKLFVTFDENFSSEVGKCFKYAYEKINSVLKILDEIGYNDSFLGMVVQYISENEPDAMSLINQNSIKNVGNQEFVNFSKKFSVVLLERYYINFDLSSFRFIETDENKISVVIDINNRYGIEYKGIPAKPSDIDDIKALHELMTEEFLEKLLREGELNLNEPK